MTNSSNVKHLFLNHVHHLQFLDAGGRWLYVRLLSVRNHADTVDLTANRALAALFISEADAWVCASRFRLPPERTRIAP